MRGGWQGPLMVLSGRWGLGTWSALFCLLTSLASTWFPLSLWFQISVFKTACNVCHQKPNPSRETVPLKLLYSTCIRILERKPWRQNVFFLKGVQFNCYFSCHSPIHLFPFFKIYSRAGFYYFLSLCFSILVQTLWKYKNLAKERIKKTFYMFCWCKFEKIQTFMACMAKN